MAKKQKPHPQSFAAVRARAASIAAEDLAEGRQKAVMHGQDAGYFNELAYSPLLRREAGEDVETGRRANSLLLGEIMLREAYIDDVVNANGINLDELRSMQLEQIQAVEQLKREQI